MTAPLVFVRSTVVWTRASDFKRSTRVVEPLVLDAMNKTFVATGERNAKGQLLYRVAC